MQGQTFHRVSDNAWAAARRLSGPLKSLVPLSAKHFAHYVRRFGPLHGPALFDALHRGEPGSTAELRLPGYRNSLRLRRGTSDTATFLQVFISHEYRLRERLEPSVIVDAGANIGMSTLWFAHHYPSARVIAIEPDEGNFALLRENTRAYANVTSLQAALWCNSTRLSISNPEGSPWSFEVIEDPHGPILGLTLDEVVQEAGASAAQIVKMDIEGSEREVLERAPSWLADADLIFCELHERKRPGCKEALDRIAQEGGFAREIAGEKHVLVRPGIRL